MSSPPVPGPGVPSPPSPPSPPPLPTLTLDSLDDDVLGLITAAAYSAGGHSGLFSASRRLSTIGAASLTELTVRRPPILGQLREDEVPVSTLEVALLQVGLPSPSSLDAEVALLQGGLPSPSLLRRMARLMDQVAAVHVTCEPGRRFLSRATGVRAVTLRASGDNYPLCPSCAVATEAAVIGVGRELSARPYLTRPLILDGLYGQSLMRHVRELPLHSFSASGNVLSAITSGRVSSAPLLALHLHNLFTGVGRAVGLLLGHHGGTLRELTLGFVLRRCMPISSNVALAFNAPAGGMPALHTLTLAGVRFDVDDLTAVAAACPALTSLAVDGRLHHDACRAVDARALPSLIRLSWTTACPIGLQEHDLRVGPLLAGRALEAAAFGRHIYKNQRPPMLPGLLLDLNVAVSLPVELDLVAVESFDDDADLCRLVDGSPGASRVERLRLAVGAGVTEEGLAALGRLPLLTSLSIFVTDVRCETFFRTWPIPGLTHLGVLLKVGVAPEVFIPPLLTALAASPTASTLRSLSLTCRPLEAASSADNLGRLTRLRHLYCRLVDPDGVPYHTPADAAVARAPMAAWMLQRLPRVTVVAGVPAHWAGCEG